MVAAGDILQAVVVVLVGTGLAQVCLSPQGRLTLLLLALVVLETQMVTEAYPGQTQSLAQLLPLAVVAGVVM